MLHNSSAKKKEWGLAIILTMQEYSKMRKIILFGTEYSVCYRIPRQVRDCHGSNVHGLYQGIFSAVRYVGTHMNSFKLEGLCKAGKRYLVWFD